MAGELIILIGLQASGKTTFFAQRFAGTHAHVSKDLLSRHARDKGARQAETLQRVLATGGSAVVDNTNARAAERAELIELARHHGARTIGYFFEPQVGDSIRRNESRQGRARVPKVAIFTTCKKLQPPSWEEGFDELYDVRIAPDGAFSVVQRAK